ncbi:MAG: hypothetical protein WBD40_10715 [Tepidisphaeraceae bacterium]
MQSTRVRVVVTLFTLLLPAVSLRAADMPPATRPTAMWEPDVFPISFWCGVPVKFISQERFKEVADAGFTHAMPGLEQGAPTIADNQRILDYCQAVGIKAFLYDGRMPTGIGPNGEGKERIDAIVVDYAKHPALAGYFIGDEPGAGAFPALAATFAYLAQKDPTHPAYVNLYPNYCPPHGLGTATYDAYIQQWLQQVKPAILSYDHYHFMSKFDRPGFFANLATVRRESLKSNVPFWQIALLINHFDYRKPTEAEKRFEAMQTLAFGGKGFMYFTYWQPFKDWGTAIINLDGTRTHQYDEVKRINRDVQAIGKHLIRAKSTAVIEFGQAGDTINTGNDVVRFDGPHITAGLFDGSGETRYAMFANRDYRNATSTTLTLETGGKRLQLLDKQTGEWADVALVDGKVRLNLAAGDGELYRW